jgi:Ca-activated chloride channel homolog
MWPFSRSPRNDRQFSISDVLPFVAAPLAEKAVELQSLDIRVVVSGLYAETSQIMRFYNPNTRDLEGTLTFPLPDDAVVCGYALNVEDEMIDGVVVPKQEARRILEAEERKGVDPGLVEKVQGNVYRTRIYPVPAKGTRRVGITYVNDLTIEGDDAAYHLPLSHAEKIENVSLRVEVIQAPVKPDLSGGVGKLTLNQWEDRWVAEAKLGKGTPSEDLQVRLPRLPELFHSVEKTSDDELFFYISKKLVDDTGKTKNWKPKRIAIAWDASGSRTEIGRDLDLLKELFIPWSEVEVDVMVFRDRIEDKHKTFIIENGKADSLLDYLRSLPYDGGTNLAALNFANLLPSVVDAWFLFSDGMGTVECGLPSGFDTRVFAITSQTHCDSAFMQHVAEESGGAYLNLLRMQVQEATRKIYQFEVPPKLTGAKGCNDLHLKLDIGRLTIIGRLLELEAVVQLSGSEAPSDSFQIHADSAVDGRTIARAWAGQETKKIALIDTENSEKMLAIGRKYSLVTPGTSLLVLESLEQYLEYSIEPPASLPRMLEAYRRHKSKQKKDDDNRQREQIEQVLQKWDARIQWWEKDFHAERKKPKKKMIDNSLSRINVEMALSEIVKSSRTPVAHAPFADMMMEDEIPEDDVTEEMISQPTIHIKPWSPDTPYLTAMRQAGPDQVYSVYLEERSEYSESPAFFLDCGDYLLKNDHHEYGLRILSNLMELNIDDIALMRMYAWRLQQADELDIAISVLERVRSLRDDEPQSHRDLALALGERWQRDRNSDDAFRAMELLYDVILRPWDRFPEIEIIALMELNRLIHFSGQEAIAIPDRIDRRFQRLLDLDVRISMSWDADLTDVDLHIFEPTGEHAYYGHNLTEIGGLVSRDFTQGYGPEEYVLRKVLPGVYTIKAHYYGSSQQAVVGACTVIVTVFTNYGRANEEKQVLTLRLDKPSDEVLVGEISIEGDDRTINSTDKDTSWQERFRSLKPEMTVNEIIEVVGQPIEIQGDEEMVLVYRPENDVLVHVRAAPKLISVQQIMDGATLDLV